MLLKDIGQSKIMQAGGWGILIQLILCYDTTEPNHQALLGG